MPYGLSGSPVCRFVNIIIIVIVLGQTITTTGRKLFCRFHPAMAAVVPVRKALKVRTAFNILGPLLNPADAAYGLIGVYSPAISGLMASTLQRLGSKRALVVHSNGLDELTPLGDSEILEVTPSGTRSYRCARISFCLLVPNAFAAHFDIHPRS